MAVVTLPEQVCTSASVRVIYIDFVLVHKGIRTTGADFVTNKYHRENIDLAVETVVDKINFEERNGQLEAKSVVIVDKSGQKREVKARKEIIVSGGKFSGSKSFCWTLLTEEGAYCSPGILLRSGIGPKVELEKLKINCIVDSPGVGQNLLDHLVCSFSSPAPSVTDFAQIVFAFYEVTKEGLTNDHLVYGGSHFLNLAFLTDL